MILIPYIDDEEDEDEQEDDDKNEDSTWMSFMMIMLIMQMFPKQDQQQPIIIQSGGTPSESKPEADELNDTWTTALEVSNPVTMNQMESESKVSLKDMVIGWSGINNYAPWTKPYTKNPIVDSFVSSGGGMVRSLNGLTFSGLGGLNLNFGGSGGSFSLGGLF